MAIIRTITVRITAVVSDLERQLQNAQRALNRTGETFKKVGASLTASLTAPLAGLGLAAGNFAANSEKAMGKLQSQLGITGEEAEKLGDIAKNVWKNAFGDSLDEVAEALALVKKNMEGVSDTDLQGLTEQAFILRDTFGADIAQSTKTASTMMKNFGIDGQKAFDIMTVGFQKGGDYSGELLDTLNEYAPQFSTMGHSAEGMLNILIAGAKGGAFNLDKVGDAMKEFNIRAKDGSTKTADGFAMIGLNAKQMGTAIAEGGTKGEQAFQATIAGLAAMTDPVARTTAGVALFGTQWEDLESKVITAMATTTDQLGVVDGATQKAGEALNNNFGSRLTEMWRNAQTALEPLGVILLNLAESWLPKISTAIESIVTWFENLSPKMQNVTVIIGLVVAAIGPLLIAIGMMTTAIAGTIIPMAASIASATATAISWIFLGSEGTRSAIQVVAAWASTAAGAIASAAVNVAQFAIMVAKWVWMGTQSLLQAARMAAAWIIALGPIAWVTAAIVAVVAVVIANWDTIKATTEKIWGAIAGFFVKTWESIKSTASSVFNSIANVLSGVWDSITKKVESVWQGITGTIKNAINNVIGLINSFINKFNGITISIPTVDIPSVTVLGKTIGGGSIGGQTFGMPQIPNIPKLAIGTNNVPYDMVAMLHKGEAVVPKAYNPALNNNNLQGNKQSPIINTTINVDGRKVADAISRPQNDRSSRYNRGMGMVPT
jgi:phage-related minor tail protein